MKILFIGYSDILKRKIVPYLKNSKKIQCEVASKKKVSDDLFLKTYKNYYKAINETKSKIIYISLVNSLHYRVCKYALNKKKHVIVDKPLALTSKNYFYLINLAKKNQLFLIEATVFHFSKRFKSFYKKIDFKKKLSIKIKFTIPKLPNSNFRNYKNLGGGCYNDMSSYALKCIDLFCKKKEYKIYLQKTKKNLIKNFRIKIVYEKFKLESIFKFESNYNNFIRVINQKTEIFYPMAFSQNINENQYFYVNKNKISFIKENSFGTFLKEVLKIIESKNFNKFYNELTKLTSIRKKIEKKL